MRFLKRKTPDLPDMDRINSELMLTPVSLNINMDCINYSTNIFSAAIQSTYRGLTVALSKKEQEGGSLQYVAWLTRERLSKSVLRS